MVRCRISGPGGDYYGRLPPEVGGGFRPPPYAACGQASRSGAKVSLTLMSPWGAPSRGDATGAARPLDGTPIKIQDELGRCWRVCCDRPGSTREQRRPGRRDPRLARRDAGKASQWRQNGRLPAAVRDCRPAQRTVPQRRRAQAGHGHDAGRISIHRAGAHRLFRQPPIDTRVAPPPVPAGDSGHTATGSATSARNMSFGVFPAVTIKMAQCGEK